MRVLWDISEDDALRVRSFVAKMQGNAFVQLRKRRNLAETKPRVERPEFWFQMVAMRLTSIQRSGPDSPIAKFIRIKPFPLRYDVSSECDSLENHIAETLKGAGGIRFSNKIAEDLTENMKRLREGQWARVLEICNQFTGPVTSNVEREAARYIQEHFSGFGPKQSRNLLQSLGLTRFEIPIDSRVTKWLNGFGFPVRLNAAVLSDAAYYEFVSDGIQALCENADIFPCVLDAAIFAAKDGNGWNNANVAY